ncbi:hypothetical protein GGR32_000750 [Mesonia hippocampi]|uniref:Uncharacterized protein n=1 Tax=Mesonia hippocampi TaxID=1628250 RepID=A0A840ESU8_9FLAO|nr:TonB-dependent receptor [Mesonia hippocampi]MBB4118476.1 hypothetical protein [Mesonia hippocampi]
MSIKKLHSYKKALVILFLLAGCFAIYGQEASLQGKVTDTLQEPIAYANLIATPLEENQNITFAISDAEGRYKLKLLQAVNYKVEITHMTFNKHTDSLTIIKNTQKNYSLKERTESLKEVIIEKEMAVIVKDDTITYRTNQFETGEERKLRDILKKLPGVEVDKAGNVTVNGKKVTKLMVEGKTFFTGDTKLGVNNIPADAIEEVEVLDNYNEVSFLKGLSDSDQMALNIKLKEGKKKFVFGDIETGAGVKNRYLIHPKLFYYSPKTAINIIGDFNNIGKKSFTIQDYIDFEGGFASMLENSTSFKDITNSDFAVFLNQNDFKYQKNDFAAGSLSQQINSKLRLEAFSIVNKGKTQTQTTNNISYLTQGSFNEFREDKEENSILFSLNKLKLRYQHNDKSDLAYDAFIKTSNGDALQQLGSFTENDSTLIKTKQKPKNISINQEIRYNKQFSYKHTSTLTANYNYNHQEKDNNWLFNQPVFTQLIPFQQQKEFYKLLQTTETKKHQATLDLKHYWVLNNFNHIYPRVGVVFLDETFNSLDKQLLENGEINNFHHAGFNNDLHFRLTDNYIGFQYKTKVGSFIFKPGIMYHSYFWKIHQFSEEAFSKQKNVWLPELNIDYEISSIEKIELNYYLKTSFSNASAYANRLRLISFNQLYRGNENLENQLYHSALLRYRKFNMYRGVFFNASLSYIKREKSVRNTTQIEGIDQVNTSVYTSLPENTYSFNGSFTKQISKYRFTFRGGVSISDYSRFINDKVNNYQSENYKYTIKAETRFKTWPNIEIGWQQQLSNFQGASFSNKFIENKPYANLEWDFFNDFIVKANYRYNYYKNKNTNQINHFDIGDFSIFYNKENSLWSFELAVDNIFDVDYKNENTIDQFMITDRNIYLQPRTVLFKLSYKL